MMLNLSKKSLANLLLIATVVVWGATFTLVKSALAHVSPLLFNLLRMSLATMALAAINHRHLRTLTQRDIKVGALAGLFLAAGYQLQTLGLVRTSPTKSAFITGLVVIFVPALTLFPVLRPPATAGPSPRTGLGAVVAFAGLLLLTTPTGTSARYLLASIGIGDLLTLVCALAFAAHLLTLAHFASAMPAGLLATLQIAACTLFMLATLPAEHTHITPTPGLILTLLICSLLATAAAFTIQSFAQQVLPPTHTVLLLTLEPVFAWMTALLFLHQSLDRRSLGGAALIMLGIATVELVPGTKTTEISS